MALTLEANNSLLMNGSEQELFPVTTEGLKHYSTKVFFHNLVSGDEILIRVYDEDPNGPTQRRYRTTPVEGLLKDPEILVNWIPSSAYRVTCQQITGPFKTITWALYSS